MNHRLRKESKWEIAKYAYQNSSFYSRIAEENHIDTENLHNMDWESIPVIHKGMLFGRVDSLITNEYIVRDYMEELISLFTSGTTGTCLNIKWAKENADKSLSCLWWKRYHEFGIHANDRYCYFFNARNLEWKGIRYDRRQKFSLGIYSGDLTLDVMKEVYCEMLCFHPKWLLLQPSILEIICIVKEKYNLPDIESLQYIELTGEMTRKGLSQRAESLLGCRIRNQYGCNEAFSIAYECRSGIYHCMESNVYIEVLDENKCPVDDGVEGDIYITSLNNYAMPFIRYAIGDRGRIFHNYSCTCGKTGTVIELTSGRSSEMIRLKGGEKISAFTFARVINIINEQLQDVVFQYQVIQKDIDDFLISLVIDDGFSKEELIGIFFQELNEPLLENARFEFAFPECIRPDERTGKVRCFMGM